MDRPHIDPATPPALRYRAEVFRLLDIAAKQRRNGTDREMSIFDARRALLAASARNIEARLYGFYLP